MKPNTFRDLLRGIPAWGWVIAGLSLGLTFALAVDLSPWLRGDADWRWDYLPVFTGGRVLFVAVCLAAYIALAALAWRWGEVSERRAGWVVSGAVALAIPFQLIALTINNPDPLNVLMFRITSPYMSGFHDIGIKVEDASEYLQAFPQLVENYLPHTQRRPPGLILYFAGLKRLLSAAPSLAAPLAKGLQPYRCVYWPMLYANDADFAAAAGGLLTLGLNAAALWPFFAAAQLLLGRRAALGAALLSPLIPGYVMWAGIWDQALVLITCLLLWLLCLALYRQKRWAWIGMGVLLSFGSFITYAVLPFIGFVIFCVALELWREPALRQKTIAQKASSNSLEAARGDAVGERLRTVSQWFLNAAGFAAGLVSLWAVYWLLSGVSFFEIYRATTGQHFAMQSGYWSRLFYNPYDFALYLSFALALLALVAATQIIRAWRQRQATAAHSFALAGLLMIGAITVLNLSRAEVGRVWVPYMPLMALAAFTVDNGPARSVGRWVAVALLVAAQLLVMLSIFIGYSRDRLYPATVPSEAIPLNVTVGEAIELAGYNVDAQQVRPGEPLQLKLHWRALQHVTGQYVVFVHLFNPELGLAASHDRPPQDGQYPTSCWQAGEVITDEIPLNLDPNARPGSYELRAGMYNPAAANQRLPLSGANVRDAMVILTQIEVK